MNWPLWLMLVFIGLALVLIGYLVGTASVKPAGPADADIIFAAELSTHHALAMRMAGLAGQYSDDPEIRHVAFEIETDRIEQAGRVKGWSDAWKQPLQTAKDVERPALDRVDPAEVTALRRLTGTEFDIAFLQLMLRHDETGIALAKLAVTKARTSAVRVHAKTVRAQQMTEVETLESLLAARTSRTSRY
ncbi:DUF305 domain-containing protein [Lentzea sp. BCCO 10_0061]|uniref:DUF305 domain-containing protein n=1 Tax=Lentzea sokolovensis TaxID=3095429 RepID=A0ABU4UUN2_9PSEU|nr:DUF305 domain-containing protein [Lentzea sp. BCCO 10_0061]MDX8143169.1 DUF305 domain-containing protein [Lentzea sp. BCCO 10_0061]